MKIRHYLFVLRDKENKVVDSFSICSTGRVLPVVAYKGTLGLHPEIKEVKNFVKNQNGKTGK